MAEKMNKKATLVGDYYARESKIDDDMKALMQKLAEMKANKQKAAKKNRQYLALRIFELFFENSELGKIFAYNRGDVFRSEEKVDTLLIMFDEVAEKIKADNDTFGLKDVDFSEESDVEDDIDENNNENDNENETEDEDEDEVETETETANENTEETKEEEKANNPWQNRSRW